MNNMLSNQQHVQLNPFLSLSFDSYEELIWIGSGDRLQSYITSTPPVRYSSIPTAANQIAINSDGIFGLDLTSISHYTRGGYKLWTKKIENKSIISITDSNDLLLYGKSIFTLMNTSGFILKETPVEQDVTHLLAKGKLMAVGHKDGRYTKYCLR